MAARQWPHSILTFQTVTLQTAQNSLGSHTDLSESGSTGNPESSIDHNLWTSGWRWFHPTVPFLCHPCRRPGQWETGGRIRQTLGHAVTLSECLSTAFHTQRRERKPPSLRAVFPSASIDIIFSNHLAGEFIYCLFLFLLTGICKWLWRIGNSKFRNWRKAI